MEKRYKVDDSAEYTSWYSTLIGPNFECTLGEPEDRTWYRDGADVVNRLNEQDEAIRTLLKLGQNIIDEFEMVLCDLMYTPKCIAITDQYFQAVREAFRVDVASS